MNKLKQRWGIESNYQIILILIVFALTGSTSAKIAGPFCEFIGLHQDSSPWYFYWLVRILLIFPIYQVLLVLFGWLFGQFDFFWKFEKRCCPGWGWKNFELT